MPWPNESGEFSLMKAQRAQRLSMWDKWYQLEKELERRLKLSENEEERAVLTDILARMKQMDVEEK